MVHRLSKSYFYMAIMTGYVSLAAGYKLDWHHYACGSTLPIRDNIVLIISHHQNVTLC